MSLPIDPKDLENLQIFIRRAKEIEEMSLEGEKLWGPTLRIDAEKGMSIEGPSKDRLFAIAGKVRQFIMAKDRANFEKNLDVLADLCKKQGDTAEATNAQKIKDMWSDSLSGKIGTVKSYQKDGSRLIPGHVLDLYLYGGGFHTDPEKEKEWNNLAKEHEAFLDFILQDIMLRLSVLIMMVARHAEKKLVP